MERRKDYISGNNGIASLRGLRGVEQVEPTRLKFSYESQGYSSYLSLSKDETIYIRFDSREKCLAALREASNYLGCPMEPLHDKRQDEQ
jgi:hypothetical protein